MTSPAALRLRRAFRWAPRLVDTFGEQALFYGQSLQSIPLAVKLYRREMVRLIAEMAFGTGGLLVVGGTVGVTAFLTLASGGVIAVQGYSSLLIPTDLLWSFLQAIAMSIAVMLVHTYYGYNAKGGPVGVGVATGDAVRTSLIVVVVITLLISLAVYGSSGKFALSG
jgi:ABC-type transporter Mla maintaining outer membrane lipid asymmetry permease subunit MlaE